MEGCTEVFQAKENELFEEIHAIHEYKRPNGWHGALF